MRSVCMQIKHLITSAGNKNAIQESHMEGYLAERELLKQELLKDGTKPTAINLVCCDEDLEDLLSGALLFPPLYCRRHTPSYY